MPSPSQQPRSGEPPSDASPELIINVQITPHPRELSLAEFDELCDGELGKYGVWLANRGTTEGGPGQALTGMERKMIKGFVYYLYTRDEGPSE